MKNRFLRFTDKKVRASSDEVVMDLFVEWKLEARYTWRFDGTITPAPDDDRRKYIEARAATYAMDFK